MKKGIFSKQKIKEFLLINLGVFIMAAAYSILLDPNKIIVGGVGGLATILSIMVEKSGHSFSPSIFIAVINIVLLILALIFVSKEFFIKTIYASIVFPLFTFIWELIYDNFLTGLLPDLTNIPDALDGVIDTRIYFAGAYLVIVLIGSIMSGVGLGLAIRNGSSTGGVDIVQKILHKYLKMPFSASLIIVDGLIVALAGIYFADIFTIIYGAMFIYISGFVMDSIIFSGFNSRCVNIVTEKPEEVKEQIFKVLNRGVTIVHAIGGYTGINKPVIVCVMSNNEFYKMKEIIRTIDPKAFIYVTKASEVHGEGFSPENMMLGD